ALTPCVFVAGHLERNRQAGEVGIVDNIINDLSKLGLGGLGNRILNHAFSVGDKLFVLYFDSRLIGLLAVAVGVGVVVASFIFRRGHQARPVALWPFVLVLIIAYLVLPDHIGRNGGSILARLPPIFALLGLACLRGPTRPGQRRAVVAVVYIL